MGNHVMKCCVGVAVVRVMRPSGRIDEFDFPVTASEVMQQYPQHLVIHSSYNSSFDNHRRKVSIVRPESKLLPGHQYILYPIPDQYRETVAQSVAKQMCNTDDEGTATNEEDENSSSSPMQHQLKGGVNRRSQLWGATRHHVASFLKSTTYSRDVWCAEKSTKSSRYPHTGGFLEGGERTKVDEDSYREDEGEAEAEADGQDLSFCYGASWKPSLYSIPESPLVPAAAHTRRHSSSSLSSPSTPASPSLPDRLENW